MTRTTVYLAGKINKGDWRTRLATGTSQIWGDETGASPFPWRPRPVLNNLITTGPFFSSTGHGVSHGRSKHGIQGIVDDGPRGSGLTPRHDVFTSCATAIAAAEWFFLWLDDETAYGSLVELGMARALGKKIFIAYHTRFNMSDMFCAENENCQCDGYKKWGDHGYNECHTGHNDFWFAMECADYTTEGHDPIRALAALDDLVAPKPVFGSPVEEKFWTAFQGRPLAKKMIPQFEYKRASGSVFRPDFAFPDVKVAIEIDGFKYHATPEAFAADLARQREMEDAGWRFRRFTGKEINADAFACVISTEKFLTQIEGNK